MASAVLHSLLLIMAFIVMDFTMDASYYYLPGQVLEYSQIQLAGNQIKELISGAMEANDLPGVEMSEKVLKTALMQLSYYNHLASECGNRPFLSRVTGDYF